MGRRLRSLALVAVAAFAVPMAVQGQVVLYAGGGAIFPISDFGDANDTGWMALGGFIVPVGSEGFGIGAEGLYGNASGASDGPSADVYGGFGTLGVIFGEEGNVRPYIYGGAGILGVSVDLGPGVDGSDTQFGYEGVAGLDFPIAETVGLFVEGRYIGSSDLDMIAAIAGLAFVVGG